MKLSHYYFAYWCSVLALVSVAFMGRMEGATSSEPSYGIHAMAARCVGNLKQSSLGQWGIGVQRWLYTSPTVSRWMDATPWWAGYAVSGLFGASTILGLLYMRKGNVTKKADAAVNAEPSKEANSWDGLRLMLAYTKNAKETGRSETLVDVETTIPQDGLQSLLSWNDEEPLSRCDTPQGIERSIQYYKNLDNKLVDDRGTIDAFIDTLGERYVMQGKVPGDMPSDLARAVRDKCGQVVIQSWLGEKMSGKKGYYVNLAPLPKNAREYIDDARARIDTHIRNLATVRCLVDETERATLLEPNYGGVMVPAQYLKNKLEDAPSFFGAYMLLNRQARENIYEQSEKLYAQTSTEPWNQPALSTVSLYCRSMYEPLDNELRIWRNFIHVPGMAYAQSRWCSIAQASAGKGAPDEATVWAAVGLRHQLKHCVNVRFIKAAFECDPDGDNGAEWALRYADDAIATLNAYIKQFLSVHQDKEETAARLMVALQHGIKLANRTENSKPFESDLIHMPTYGPRGLHHEQSVVACMRYLTAQQY